MNGGGALARRPRPEHSRCSEVTTVGAHWTAADQAELDVLLLELTTSYDEHRKRCEYCQPCSVPRFWKAHKEACPACAGYAPLTFGPPCKRHAEFIAHGATCKPCTVCPHLKKAIAAVLDWRAARILLSRAETLRAERDRLVTS